VKLYKYAKVNPFTSKKVNPFTTSKNHQAVRETAINAAHYNDIYMTIQKKRVPI